MNRFHVITGGPGAGKSTLIAALAAHGLAYRSEAGRAVIRAQTAEGGSALPWGDRAAFAARMFAEDEKAYRTALEMKGRVIFDRGLPDVIGYLRLCGLDAPAHMRATAAALRYNPKVFIAPPWREIFVNDAERKQGFAETEATYDAMTQVYTEFGYTLIRLPLACVEDRVRFVLGALDGVSCAAEA